MTAAKTLADALAAPFRWLLRLVGDWRWLAAAAAMLASLSLSLGVYVALDGVRSRGDQALCLAHLETGYDKAIARIVLTAFNPDATPTAEELERQRTALEDALAALENVEELCPSP